MLEPKKTFSAAFLLIFIFSFFLQLYPAQAAFSWPQPSTAFDQIMANDPSVQIFQQLMEDTLGVKKEELKNTVSQVNVLRQKQNPPQVSLNFFPANPLPGEEVTVTATPTYFVSDPKNLYFTWYIKHHNNGNRDLNGDGNIDIEDYKIEAARLIANGGWDWDPDGNSIPDGDVYATHNDADGYVAAYGGEDQRDKPAHCYMHDWASGNDYEITAAPGCEHLFPDDGIGTLGGSDGGNPSFNLDQEKFWRTDPNNNDTSGAQQKDESSVIGLGRFEFKFNYQEGDKVGVAIEGASYQATDYPDSSYKTMWALVKNKCDIGSSIPEEDRAAGPTTAPATTAITAVEGSVNIPPSTCSSFGYSGFGVCQPDNFEYQSVTSAGPSGCVGGSPILTNACTYSGSGACTSFSYTPSYSACQPNGIQYREIATVDPPGCLPTGFALTQSCTYVPTPLPLTTSANQITADGIDPAEWPDMGYLKIDDEIIRYNTLSTAVSGGGIIFSNLLRGADGTAAAEHNDNALITGLTSTAVTEVTTETAYSTSQNKYITTTTTKITTTVTDARGTVISTATTQSEETASGSDSYSGAVSRINDCLEENMLSPAEGNPSEKLKVNLFYTPTAPMFSSENEDIADYLMLNSGLENASNEDYLIYDWQIFGPSFDPNPSGWPALLKSSLPESTQTRGVGVKSLKFKLYFPGWGGSSVRYLKAKLTITEKRPDQTTETVKGNASVIIPIAPASTVLGIYSAFPHSSSPAPKASLINPATGDVKLRCDTGIQSAVCPVVKDEIVGLSINPNPKDPSSSSFKDILWTVNGERIKYAECFFDGCDPESQTDTMFIPILNDIGSKYTISATAINSVTGDKLNLTRTLVVTNPTMRIVSNDQGVGSTGARAVLLGTYIPIDPASTPTGPGGADELQDFSSTDFQALPGTQANFSMEFNVPNYFMDEEKTSWFLDGQDGSSFVTGSSLSFPVNKLVGESYSITTNSIYRQDPLIQQMLNHYWGVRIDQLYETQLSGKVDLSVVSVLNGQLAGADANQSLPRKMLAALSYGAPAYLLFLFRIVLTTGLLLFFIRLILSLVPKNYET